MASKALAIIAGVGPGTVRLPQLRFKRPSNRNIQGASIARRFAQTYSVVLLSRSSSSYEPLVQEINSSGGQAVGISTDVSDANSVNAAFDQIANKFPSSQLAATIFNPGGGFVRKPFLELTEEDYTSALRSQAYVYPTPINTT